MNGTCPPSRGTCTPRLTLLASYSPTLVQLLIVGDFNIPAEPRDMHPSLGPYDESYGEEERTALAGLMAAYPGEPR